MSRLSPAAQAGAQQVMAQGRVDGQSHGVLHSEAFATQPPLGQHHLGPHSLPLSEAEDGDKR